MKKIIVLGSGCKKCVKTAELIQSIADECHVDISLVKETSPEVIMHFGVMSTPAVVIDDTLMHTGSIPNREKVQSWMQ
jgi:glutaredoxin